MDLVECSVFCLYAVEKRAFLDRGCLSYGRKFAVWGLAGKIDQGWELEPHQWAMRNGRAVCASIQWLEALR